MLLGDRILEWVHDRLLSWTVILGFILLVLIVGYTVWNASPWSRKHHLEAARAEITQQRDDLKVAAGQAAQDHAIDKAVQDTLTIRIQQEAQTARDVAAVQNAPDPVSRRDAYMRGLCRTDLYASQPECEPYR